jgi:hypothetical protein
MIVNETKISPSPITGHTKPNLPPVVQVNWKLPARLRKPIRQQLQKERVEKKKREAIVRFERRPLTTQSVLSQPRSSRPDVNTGAEHHTGDMYKASRPAMRVALPPYAGNVSQGLLTSSRGVQRPQRPVAPAPLRPTSRGTAPVQPKRMQSRKSVPIRKVVTMAKPTVRPHFWEAASNDVADEQSDYVPEEAVYAQEDEAHVEEQIVERPKRLLSMPFSINVWPLSLFSGKKNPTSLSELRGTQSQDKRFFKIWPNIAVLLVGFGLVAAAIWNLQSLGRGVGVLGSVQSQAQQAYAKILTAQSAFAATDFTSGEQDLAQAQDLLTGARTQLTDSLSAAQVVLQTLDVTNTLHSGDRLLQAGEELTAAGQDIARGASGFFHVNVLPGKEAADTVQQQTLVDALSFAHDQFVSATGHLDIVQKDLDGIGSPLLPANLQQQVATLQTAVPKLNTFLKQFDAQSNTLLDLLGANRQRQYLLVFANNDELRPVGGFIGSVGLINVDKGQVENINVDSVYDPDGQLKQYIAPPQPLLSIVDRWYMRDANWWADYPTSAKKISEFFEKEGGPTVDGVIMMTPDVIKRLLTVTGPIEMPAYNVTVSADNFSVVTQGEVTYDYDKTTNKPKQFLADLTPVLLNKLMGSSNGKVAVLSALAQSVQQKELLLYFKDQDVEQELKDAGWAGALPDPKAASGYLLVDNANIGGHKSDQFISQDINYQVAVNKAGQAQVTLTIQRTHHGPDEAINYPYPPNEDPSKKDNVVYQRVLVPLGSKLISGQGYTPASDVPKLVVPDNGLPVQPDADVTNLENGQTRDASGTVIGQESGYTSFANWIITKPGQTTVTVYQYTLPGTTALPNILATAQKYSLYVGKQAGAKRTTLRVSLDLPDDTKIVHYVPSTGITQESDHTIVYRGDLSTDAVVGAVFSGK